jgi:hypothetical protein
MRLRDYTIAIVTFLTTGVLTCVSIFLVKLESSGSFLVFSTGATISLAIALVEQRLRSNEREMRRVIKEELHDRLDLCRLVDSLGDQALREEVYSLARSLSAGEVPPHIAAVRMPALYEQAQIIYASNVSLTVEKLRLWEENPRFRGIVETSRRRAAEDGARFWRTFVLSRSMLDGASLDARCGPPLTRQIEAQIEVRVIWLEDMQGDDVAPRRKLVRNFTIFDETEAVDTTDVQVIYRLPSTRVQDFLAIRAEQLKYSEPIEPYLPA